MTIKEVIAISNSNAAIIILLEMQKIKSNTCSRSEFEQSLDEKKLRILAKNLLAIK